MKKRMIEDDFGKSKESLTKTEKDILERLSIGKSVERISNEKEVTKRAVYKIIKNIKRKIDIPYDKPKGSRDRIIINNLKREKRYQRCLFCSYSKLIQIHHLKSKEDKRSNLIPVCPNCHQEIHHLGYNEIMIKKIVDFLNEDILKIMNEHNQMVQKKGSIN